MSKVKSKKTVKPVPTIETIESPILEPVKEIKTKQQIVDETHQATKDRPATTIVEATGFPVAECFRCHTYTPLGFVCKHCKETNPHKDIRK